jgi:HPr kinase/phosphorylase
LDADSFPPDAVRPVSEPAATVHASAVLTGARAVLIRGPSAAGKSRLALALLQSAQSGLLPFARLVGDDRLHLEAHHERLIARPPAALAGLIEVRGLGIRRVPYEPAATVGMVVDLAATDTERLPASEGWAVISGVRLPRLAVASRADPLALILAFLGTTAFRGQGEK